MAESAPVAQAIQADSDDLGFKTFVGNLAFSTTSDELKQVFSKAGEVTDAQIINRGSRSLGYGFVTFATEQAATTAISTLDKTSIHDRQINVELAKPPGGGKLPKAAAAAAVKSEATTATAVDGESADKPKRKTQRKKKPRQPRTDGETEEAGDAPATNGASSAAAATNGATLEAPTPAPASGARKPREPRKPRGAPVTGPPSETMLFVANLPFAIKDAELSKLFADEGFPVKSARVIRKRYGPGAGRSKGFGFVELETTEAQQGALEKLNGKEIEGRNLAIKIAVQQESQQDGDAAGDDTGIASGEIIAS